jgi:hypothetical protein
MGDALETLSTVIAVTVLILTQQYPQAALLIMAGGVTAQYLLISAIGKRGPELPDSAGLRINSRSTMESVKVVYGTLRVGGNDVYIKTTGEDNKFLWVVQTLSEGECEGILQDGGQDQVFIGDVLENDFGAFLTYTFHSGTSNQAVDATLNAADALWTDPLHYTTYIVWKFQFNQNYYQSFPQRSVVLQGRKLFDFRDSSTAYSNNPVLCLYDYMTNSRYGLGIDSAKIDTTSWGAAATYCDNQNWGLNYRVSGQEAAQDVIDVMLTSFRGSLVWWDGKYYLNYADLNLESSVMTLDDEDIYVDESGKAQISLSEPSDYGVPDGVLAQFTNIDEGYIPDTFIIGDTEGVIEELDYTMCATRDQVAALATYQLERLQLNRVIAGTFKDKAVKLEPEDIVTLTSTALSIEDAVLRVKEANFMPSGLVYLTFEYETADLYDDDFDINEGVYRCSLPDPTEAPPSVENVSVTEEQYNYRLRNFTRLKVTFDEPSNYSWFKHVEVWRSEDNTNWEFMFTSVSDFSIDNIEESIKYYFRLKTVSIWNTKQPDSGDYRFTHTVTGYDEFPTSLGSLEALVNENSINLYSNKVSDPDIELYEFRLGTSWSGAIFLAALRSPNLSLTGVKPGSHTFFANTLGNNGLYGETPRSAAVSLIGPPDGWDIINTETCEYEDYDYHHESCESLSGWTAVRATQVEFDSVECFKMDTGLSADAYATQDFGSLEAFGDSFTLEIKLQCSEFDLLLLNDHFNIVFERSDWKLDVAFASNGLFVHDGSSYNEVGTDINSEDVWEVWKFDVDLTNGVEYATCDIYLDGVLKASDVDCSYVGSFTDGNITLKQNGASNYNQITYVDYFTLNSNTEFDNTEAYSYSGDYYLKCSHDENVLTGTFKSPVYDRGSSARYMVYFLADIVVIGEGTTWDDVMPSPDKWTDIGISTNRWIDIFEIPDGPSVNIRLYYGDTNPPTNYVDRLEILSAIVTARYFQIEITITDPNNQVNALVDSFELKFCQPEA